MDSFAAHYSLYNENSKITDVLAMREVNKYSNKYYLVDKNDCSGLLSAFGETNYCGFSNPVDWFTSDCLL